MIMDDWQYKPAADLDQSFAEKLRNFPREPHMAAYALRGVATLKLRAWLRLYHRYKVTGRANLPTSGSFIMVANHASHLDAVCLLSSLPLGSVHRAFPAAAADYFFSSLPKSAFSAIFINALPFERQMKGGQSLEICGELLANPGNILIIFPEGTRSTTGELGRFRSGIGRLVAGRDIPVVPCFLRGAYRAWPKGKAFPRPRPLHLVIGEPRVYASRETDREAVSEIVQELWGAVHELKERSLLDDGAG